MTLQAPWNVPELSYGRATAWPGAQRVGRSAPRGLMSVRAGLAELVLLNRLRAQTRGKDAVQTLERAAQILEVTSRHWFGEANQDSADAPAP